MTDIAVEGIFVWTATGGIFDNSSPLWMPNEPGIPNTNQNCVTIVPNTYKMDDYNCKWGKRYICEMPP